MSIFPRVTQRSLRREPSPPFRLTREVAGVLLITFGLLVLLSVGSFSPTDVPLFSDAEAQDKGKLGGPQNLVGVVGATLAFGLYWLVGSAALAVPFLIVLQGIRAFREEEMEAKLRSVVGSVMTVVFLSALIYLYGSPGSTGSGDVAAIGLSGGVSGQLVATLLEQYFAGMGSLILLLSGLLVSLLLVAPFSVAAVMRRVPDWWAACKTGLSNFSWSWFPTRERVRKPKANKPVKINRGLAMRGGMIPYPRIEDGEEDPEILAEDLDKATGPTSTEESDPIRSAFEVSRKVSKGYKLPDPYDLLDPPPTSNTHQTDKILETQSRVLTGTFRNFGIAGKITEVHPGPVITMFEFEPGPGIKVARIVNLAHDLAMALKATSVRIVAPLPGKSTVGIEVPNPLRETVFLQEILTSEPFVRSRSKLTLALGKDIFGRPVVADLKTMPHLLVAGATGAGKSVGLNSMLLSILFSAHPDEVKLLLIDPKVLELQTYDGIPHLLRPVITDPKAAAKGLTWVVQEMERRYRLLSEHGVRNIHAFNLKLSKNQGKLGRNSVADAPEQPMLPMEFFDQEDRLSPGESWGEGEGKALGPPEPLPYIVVVIDEFADLMMVAPKEVEEKIARLAQMARASGSHLILATQRPSVDVVTGLIKANFPSRIAYQVSSKTDSRTILDANGAEALLGLGDMLYMASGTGRIMRLHGPFVSDEAVRRVVDCVKTQAGPAYCAEDPFQDSVVLEEELDRDEVYEQAREVVTTSGQASASLIQRRLRVGYPRAARMIEQMEEEGLVSSPGRDGRREVLVPRVAMKEGMG